MSNEPTFNKYIANVGGLAAVYLIAVLITKAILPGYENAAIYTITCIVFIVLFLKRKNNSNKKD